MITGGLQYAMSIIDKNFGIGIGKAKKETEGLDKATNKVNASVKKIGAEGKSSMDGLAESVKKVGVAWLSWKTANKIIDLGSNIAEVTDKSQKLDTQFGLTFGAAGAKNLEAIEKRAKELNLSVESNRAGFISMSQSMEGSKITGKGLMGIYEGVAVASAVMKSTGKENEAMLNSFGNVAKKKIVDFGDFKSEFADKIPGAFKIAANAMGVTENKLKTMMDNGKVSADKFLPKFAQELKSTFAGGLPEAANSIQAAMNKRENAITGFWEKLSTLFGSKIAIIISYFSGFIDWLGTSIMAMQPVGEAIWNIIMALQPLWQSLINASMLGNLTGNADGLASALNIVATVVGILSTGIATLIDWLSPLVPWIVGIIALQWAWNLAMSANPIAVVILAIAALIGIIVTAYNKIGWFRGAIMATWEAIKGFAKAIKDYVVNRLMDIISGVTGIGKAIVLFFKGDWNAAWEAGKKASKDLMGIDSKKKLINDLAETGKKSGEAYQKGIAEAKANTDLAKVTKKEVASKSANDKFFDEYSSKTKSDGTIAAGDAKAKGKSVTGSADSKHTTFNIHSFVDKMTISTNNLGGTPADIEREMQKIFNKIISDLEVRVNG